MSCVVTFDFMVVIFFFKQKTAYEMRISDWSSDVCSSDLSRLRCHEEDLVVRSTGCSQTIDVRASLLAPVLLCAEGKCPTLAGGTGLSNVCQGGYLIGSRDGLGIGFAVTAALRPRRRLAVRTNDTPTPLNSAERQGGEE